MPNMEKKNRKSRAEYFREYRKKNKPAKRVSVSMSPAEYAELARQAKRHGLKPTSFLKAAMYGYSDRKYVVPEEMEEKLAEVIRQLRALGTNINQIAHHANTYQKLRWGDWKTAMDAISKVEKLIIGFVRNPKIKK